MNHFEINPFTSNLERDNNKSVTPGGSPLTASTINVSLDSSELLEIDASGGDVTVNLLFSAVGNGGKELNIVKVDSSVNIITVDPLGSETINDSSTKTISFQNSAMNIVSNDLNWRII